MTLTAQTRPGALYLVLLPELFAASKNAEQRTSMMSVSTFAMSVRSFGTFIWNRGRNREWPIFLRELRCSPDTNTDTFTA